MCIGIYPIPSPKLEDIEEIMKLNMLFGNKWRNNSPEFEKYNFLRQAKPMAIFELLDNIVNDVFLEFFFLFF